MAMRSPQKRFEIAEAERLLGYDEVAEVFRSRGGVFRRIRSANSEYYRRIVRALEQTDLLSTEIVGTQEIGTVTDPPFELLLQHENIPYITYPHEWSPSMFKDAAKFHLMLFDKLENYGLTLKDWHPYNILFKGTRPVFVDFTSIIFRRDLSSVPYLKEEMSFSKRFWNSEAAYNFEMYRRMYVPYFLLPLYLLKLHPPAGARQRIFETALNAGGEELSADQVFARVPRVLFTSIEKMKRLVLALPAGVSLFRSALRKEIDLIDMRPPRSAYANYYRAKGEDLPWMPSASWTKKHTIVHEVLKRCGPRKVADLGCNTGWYSILAAKQGAEVVALDADDSSIDLLYTYVKGANLSIVPLVMDLNRLTPDAYGLKENGRHAAHISKESCPLLQGAEKRLKSDLILALAIVHHLALGQNWSFESICSLLNTLSEAHLIVEFVAKEDNLVVSEPDFFPSYNVRRSEFGWYNLENFVSALKRYFCEVEIAELSQNTRWALICRK
jgi:SAM-dependent methyltransferase